MNIKAYGSNRKTPTHKRGGRETIALYAREYMSGTDADGVFSKKRKVLLAAERLCSTNADAQYLILPAGDLQRLAGAAVQLLQNCSPKTYATGRRRLSGRNECDVFRAQGKNRRSISFAARPAQRAANSDAVVDLGLQQIGLADEL